MNDSQQSDERRRMAIRALRASLLLPYTAGERRNLLVERQNEALEVFTRRGGDIGKFNAARQRLLEAVSKLNAESRWILGAPTNKRLSAYNDALLGLFQLLQTSPAGFEFTGDEISRFITSVNEL